MLTRLQLPASSATRPDDDAPAGRSRLPAGRDVSPASGTGETVIVAHRGWFDWRLDELWRSRDLIGLFVWRDFVSIYKQTVLGPAWHLVQPLLTTLIFTIVFGRMAGLSTDGAPPFLFYMIGTLPWMFFANCLENTSKTFSANSHLLGKVYFHRLVIPLALVISNLVTFGIQFGMFLLIAGGSVLSGLAFHATAWALLTPALVLMLAGYGLGAGVLVCAMTTRYRDLRFVVGFGVQLLMFLTPVIYPMSAVPARYRWVAAANPLTPILEAFRRGLLGVGTVTPSDLALSFSIMLAMVAVALMAFARVERTFMDTV